MRIFIKIIYLSLILLIGLPSVFFGYRYMVNETQTYPYPYKVPSPSVEEIQQAENADIILIGDSSTSLLKDALQDLPSKVSVHLKNPPIIYDWGRPGETAAQTLKKLSALKSFPSLFIYHGGRDPFEKLKFNLIEFNHLKKNLDKTKDETLMTLIMAYPPLSRLIYAPVKKISIQSENNTGYPDSLPPEAVLQIMEISYQLYKMETAELFTFLKEKDASLWVIPQALNLTLKPKRVCENTRDSESEKILKKVQELAEQRRSKEAFNMANDLIKTSKGNARAYYIIGELLLSMGNNSEAKKAFYQSMIYDCGLERSNPIFLKILMEEAEKRQFKVIDFNRLVTNQLGHNILFINERDPQPLYYQQLSDIIKKEFLKFIKL
ncbi:MAG: hypothetical protein CME60_09775 [Halobacteriovoraceae bacterium]|nr:hypothetical protein [Halobacteriovoraceae bacterium]